MIFSVCVNAAGCLPDSETYPYNVDGVDAALDALENEIGETEMAPEVYTEELDAKAREVLGSGAAISLGLGTIYAVTIEPATCQWFAACDNKADTLRKGPEIGQNWEDNAPQFGEVPICARCDSRIAGMEGGS